MVVSAVADLVEEFTLMFLGKGFLHSPDFQEEGKCLLSIIRY